MSNPSIVHLENAAHIGNVEFPAGTYEDVIAAVDSVEADTGSYGLRSLEYLVRIGAIPKDKRYRLLGPMSVLKLSLLFFVVFVLFFMSMTLQSIVLLFLQWSVDEIDSGADRIISTLQGAFQIIAIGLVVGLTLYYTRRFIMHWSQRIDALQFLKERIANNEEFHSAERRHASLRMQADLRREQLAKLNSKIGSILVDNVDERNRASEAATKAYSYLGQFDEAIPIEGASNIESENYGRLTPAQSQFMSDVDELIGSIEARINREELLRAEQRNWQLVFLVGIIAYIALLLFVISSIPSGEFSRTMPNTGIPASIFVWGLFGSIGAILYKFYKVDKPVRFYIEFRWLIARPIIGIIMAGLSYLAVISGLVVANTAAGGAVDAIPIEPTAGRMELFWVLAFLAGFSDKFYESIINALVQRTTGDDNKQEDQPQTQDQIIVASTQTTEEYQSGNLASDAPVFVQGATSSGNVVMNGK